MDVKSLIENPQTSQIDAGQQNGQADSQPDSPFALVAEPEPFWVWQNKPKPPEPVPPQPTPECRAHLPPLDGPVRPWGPEDRQPWADEQPPLEDEAEQAAADASLPKHPADRCWICLGTIFWEDIAGKLHCAECEQIPVRAFASGGCWRVVQGLGDEPHRWEDYTPVGWHSRVSQRVRPLILSRWRIKLPVTNCEYILGDQQVDLIQQHLLQRGSDPSESQQAAHLGGRLVRRQTEIALDDRSRRSGDFCRRQVVGLEQILGLHVRPVPHRHRLLIGRREEQAVLGDGASMNRFRQSTLDGVDDP